MRLDVYLSAVCILKSRSLAKEACDRHKVELNGEAGKPSHKVSAGDRIRLTLGPRVLEVEVVSVPAGQVSRKQAAGHYRILADRRDAPGPEEGNIA